MVSLIPTDVTADGEGFVNAKMTVQHFAQLTKILQDIEKGILEKEKTDSTRLDTLFDKFISYYEVLSENSKKCYRQQFTNLMKWLHEEGRDVNTVGEITKEIAEQYIRYSYARKKTAKFEIRTYRRIWSEMFPPNYENPWIHRLHLATFHPKKNMSHRPYKRKEIRQILTFLDSIIESKKRVKDMESQGMRIGSRKRRSPFFATYSVGFVQDVRDAVVFAVTYGMRMGSCASLKWSDFKQFSHKSFFYHLPPKTARSKPIPLELPYLPQILEILNRRRPQNINGAYRREEPLFKEFFETYGKGACVLSGIFGRVIDKLRIKDSGIGVAAFHSFRTTFVSFMDEVGAPKMITDSITGHSSKEMHSLYSKPSAIVKKRWIAKAYASMDFSFKYDEETVKELIEEYEKELAEVEAEEEEALFEPT